MRAWTAYYDAEAYRYDATRGGQARARAAAEALGRLLRTAAPGGLPGPVLDLGTGTGSIPAEMRAGRRPVLGLDLSAGMLTVAATRMPGRVVRADAAALPIRDGVLGAVTAVWVLHLFDSTVVAAIVREVGRVLAPGGLFISTVDKSTAHRGLRPDPSASDHGPAMAELAAGFGLVAAGAGRFVSVGEGPWRPDHALPAPPGDDPVYTLAAWRSHRPGVGGQPGG